MPEQPRENSGRGGLLRSAMSMSVITMGSRILGLVRELVRAHLLGTSLASDAFGIAFQIPNLLRRLLAEGAMSAGFIPVLTELREKHGDEKGFEFARRYFNLALLIMTLVTSLGALGAGLIVSLFVLLSGQDISEEARALTESLTVVMFPYIGFVSLAAIAQGILNTFRIFWVSAFTAVLLNICIIASAIGFSHLLDEPAYGFAIGVLIGGVVQLVFQLPYVFRLGFKWRPDFQLGAGVKRALALLVPTLFGAGVYQVNVLVSQAIAWGVGNGAVSSLQYSSRLLELTLGVFAVALSTVVLPSLASDVAKAKHENVIETVQFSIRLTCFVCFPVTAGLFLTRHETVSVLFERGSFDALSTSMTSTAVAFHIIGLTFIALSRIFVPVFYAYQDTWRPVVAAFVSMIVNIGCCYALAPSLNQGGIALANSISALVQLGVLMMVLGNHVNVGFDRRTTLSVLTSLVATGVMALCVSMLQAEFNTHQLRGLSALALPYTIVVGVGVASFVITCVLLRHPELAEVKRLFKRG